MLLCYMAFDLMTFTEYGSLHDRLLYVSALSHILSIHPTRYFESSHRHLHAHYFSERKRIKETLSPLTNFYRITFSFVVYIHCSHYTFLRIGIIFEALLLPKPFFSLSLHSSQAFGWGCWVLFLILFVCLAFFLASSFFIFHFYTYIKCALFFRFLSYVGVHAFKIHIWTRGKKFYSIFDDGIISRSYTSMWKKKQRKRKR